MGQTSSMPNFNPRNALGELGEVGMVSWAKIALLVTSSHAFSRLSALLAKPGLIATGLVRNKTDQAMSRLLAYASMPSRADVLSLSGRMTHIELALDDLAAAMEALRASASQPPRAKRASVASARPSRGDRTRTLERPRNSPLGH